MTENTNKNQHFITIKNNENIFLIIQNISFSYFDIKANITELKDEKEKKNKTFSLILDINNLAKPIKNDDYSNIRNIIRDLMSKRVDNIDYKFNIYIKNSLFESFQNINYDKNKLYINKLYISDELYSISPNLNKLFVNIKGINVKNISLNRFLLFIKVFFYNFCYKYWIKNLDLNF